MGDSGSDDNPEEENQTYQDPNQRRELRHKYRQLTINIKETRHELTHPDSDGLQKKLEECNSLFKDVQMTREAALDSQVIAQLSQLGKQKARALQTDFVVFQPSEFCDKLMRFLRGGQLPETEQSPRISREGWVRLGEAVQPFFKRSPSLHFMYGSFQPGEKLAKEKKKRDLNKKDDTSDQKAKNPDEVDGVPKKESTTEQVDAIEKILHKTWTHCERTPICYFEFVINPKSFDQTVENIFYTSFLVRDGLAEVFLDEDKLPVIQPVAKKKGSDPTQMVHRQVVLTITKHEWKEVIEAYNIQEPIIPTRAKIHLEADSELANSIMSRKGKSSVTQPAKKSKSPAVNGISSSKTNGYIDVDSEEEVPPTQNKKKPKR